MAAGPAAGDGAGLCRCGCGEPSARDFLPGHDQRAIHDRIKKVGTVSEFLDWFDDHFEDRAQLER